MSTQQQLGNPLSPVSQFATNSTTDAHQQQASASGIKNSQSKEPWYVTHKQWLLFTLAALVALGAGIGIGVGIGRSSGEKSVDSSEQCPSNQLTSDETFFLTDLQSRPLRAATKPVKGLVVFGDSLSDDGNLFAKYGIPNATRNGGYGVRGRFSDGDIWSDYFAEAGYQVKDYAYGAATLCEISESKTPSIPGVVLGQVEEYKKFLANATNFPPPEERLAVIWAGHNDIFNISMDIGRNVPNDPTSLPDFIRAGTRKLLGMPYCLFRTIEELVLMNHTQIVIWNLAPIDSTPILNLLPSAMEPFRPALAAIIRAFVRGSNLVLRQGSLASLGTFATPNIAVFDVNKVLSNLLKNTTALGFKVPNASCFLLPAGQALKEDMHVRSACSNPQDYVFYDEVHVTSKVHKLLYEAFTDFLKKNKMIA